MKLKVLVVDDELGIREGIARILQNYKITYPFIDDIFEFDIIKAENGQKALDIIENEKLDLILLDNKLPDIDGIEILTELNKMDYDASVMMITAYASIELAVKATEQGAYNFLPKPFTPQELKSAIESLTKYLYLKRMTKSLSSAGKELRFRFLSVLSHELKAPLNAIEGYLRIMKDRQVGNDISNYEQMIDRCIERIKGMRTLILDLLDLTRIESGEKDRNLSIRDLVQLAQLSIDTIMPLAIQKNIKIRLNAPNELMFKCSETEMLSIFNNLLSNAVKYNKDDGEVYFTLLEFPDKIMIEVEDTGIGMTKDEQKMLFKEFTRIKNDKTRTIPGSGLGLSIVKRIVDLYHGKIQIESEPDKGTKFTITLPKSVNV